MAKTALITGASRGIGREAACTLASEGWHVIAAVRDPKTAPPGTEAQTVDMADAASIDARGIRVSAIDPGWVRTDMGGRNARRSVAEGAARVLAGIR